MKYKIKCTYDSGDSLSNEYGLVEVLDLTFSIIDNAKENLIRIKEHYEFYLARSKHHRTKKEDKKILEEAKQKDWFVEDKYDCYSALMLKADNGNTVQISAPWCGYFEKLTCAEVIDTTLEDARIEF